MKKVNSIKLILMAILYYSGIAFLMEKLISKKDAYLILCYHNIGPMEYTDTGYCVSRELFEDQVKFIKKHCNIIRFSDINTLSNSGKKNVIITFDDGFQDNYINAFGIIKKYNIPVYIFLISDFLNKQYFMNWDQIFEMKRSGLVIFGNHTKDHPALNTLGYDEIKSQILGANEELKKKLENIEYFAYPYGNFDTNAVEIIKNAGFKYALTIKEGINDRYSDPFLLKRMSIYDMDIQTRFLLKYPNLTYEIRSWYKKN